MSLSIKDTELTAEERSRVKLLEKLQHQKQSSKLKSDVQDKYDIEEINDNIEREQVSAPEKVSEQVSVAENKKITHIFSDKEDISKSNININSNWEPYMILIVCLSIFLIKSYFMYGYFNEPLDNKKKLYLTIELLVILWIYYNTHCLVGGNCRLYARLLIILPVLYSLYEIISTYRINRLKMLEEKLCKK